MLYLNNIPVNVTTFPDKTSQVWKLDEKILKNNHFAIKWDFESESELMHLCQLIELIENCALDLNFYRLEINYLPYARQDKEVSNSNTFALHSFARILNNVYYFDEIVITDPHSQKALELIKRSGAVYPIEQLKFAIKETKTDLLCYPDKGALTKYTKVYDIFNIPHIYGEKVREQLTGYITSYKVVGDAKDKTVLIVDDICDGGMTFKIIAKDLFANGAKNVNLFVTHGIFSKGIQTLKDSGINRIFTKYGEING